MMRSIFISSTLAAVAACSAPGYAAENNAEKHVELNETVYMTGLDTSTNMYSGYVHVGASPCAKAVYEINVPFSGAKDGDDAKSKVKATVDKVQHDVDRAAVECHTR